MRKIKLTTPENIEIEYKLADLGSRTAAAIIDMLIQGVILILLGLAVLLISIYSPQFWEKYLGWIIGISIVLYSLISYGYYIIMELNLNGMTPGKKVLNLRTIRNNGQPLTLKHSAIRNLFRLFIDMLGIGPVFIFFSKEHKRIGDYAASTMVIVEESNGQSITLDNLHLTDNYFSNDITTDEYELLKYYFQRRDSLENCTSIKENIKCYFENKFDRQEFSRDLKSVLDQL